MQQHDSDLPPPIERYAPPQVTKRPNATLCNPFGLPTPQPGDEVDISIATEAQKWLNAVRGER